MGYLSLILEVEQEISSVKQSYKTKSQSELSKIISEIGWNHMGDLELAKNMIYESKKNGADLVKIQSYTAETLTLNTNKKDFLIKKKNPWGRNKYLWNLYKKAETSNIIDAKKILDEQKKGKKIALIFSRLDLHCILHCVFLSLPPPPFQCFPFSLSYSVFHA